MSWKRRTMAVALGTMLVLASLTTMPATSAAFMIKWYYLPTVGDPDYPTAGMIRARIGSLEFGVYRIGTRFIFSAAPVVSPVAARMSAAGSRPSRSR